MQYEICLLQHGCSSFSAASQISDENNFFFFLVSPSGWESALFTVAGKSGQSVGIRHHVMRIPHTKAFGSCRLLNSAA